MQIRLRSTHLFLHPIGSLNILCGEVVERKVISTQFCFLEILGVKTTACKSTQQTEVLSPALFDERITVPLSADLVL